MPIQSIKEQYALVLTDIDDHRTEAEIASSIGTHRSTLWWWRNHDGNLMNLLKNKHKDGRTPENREKIRKSLLGRHTHHNAGEKSPWWKGGITPLSRALRRNAKNKLWRHGVFERDNYTCRDCGVRGSYLHAHHIKEFSKIIAENNIKSVKDGLNCRELWDTSNGITLCKECHQKTTWVVLNNAKVSNV